ncbi:glycosyltransferase [Stieleria sp. JC731]|uniref:glycosyltransferase n=1 Tax=Pirellulaceae TaxID=2691357 RepID=UPI001E2958F4|nr:glycosyltransferase [Stieleria sp. JC731]MCC9601450.1 glycosyltransferase [Stieleria sp. JC731]
MKKICIFQPSVNVASETFIKAHGERLPGVVGVVWSSNGLPCLEGSVLPRQSVSRRGARKLSRLVKGEGWKAEVDQGYCDAIRQTGAEVALAEYGPTGVAIADACRKLDLPLVVHFHGYDASQTDTIDQYSDRYKKLFDQASAVIGVSQAMVSQLQRLGCPEEKVVYNPYGIDCDRFQGASPLDSEPVFLAVGRLVEKKAPYLTILAFREVLARCPEARLRIVGDGPLMGVCRDMAIGCEVEHAVTFLGPLSHEDVQREMGMARAFVQHSVVASSGDSEGTPLAVLEAGATGIPVVATRHAGIPDVVVDGETGLLVDERDVSAMAAAMVRLAENRSLASSLGANAAKHVRSRYTMDHHITRLASILELSATGGDIVAEKSKICRELLGDAYEDSLLSSNAN